MMGNAIEIDVIILSYSQTVELKKTTLDCITSLMNSEDSNKIKFNIIVVESQHSLKPYQFAFSQTIYTELPFGYHRYMNLGISKCSSKFICLCNNDLIFQPLWATEILQAFDRFSDLASASPFCSIHHPIEGFMANDGLKFGYRIRKEVAGWCIFLRREVFNYTGKLDENYIFWGADNDYANMLSVMKFKHCLVTSAIVDHIENKTLNTQTPERQFELTKNENIYFYKKWRPRAGAGWVRI